MQTTQNSDDATNQNGARQVADERDAVHSISRSSTTTPNMIKNGSSSKDILGPDNSDQNSENYIQTISDDTSRLNATERDTSRQMPPSNDIEGHSEKDRALSRPDAVRRDMTISAGADDYVQATGSKTTEIESEKQLTDDTDDTKDASTGNNFIASIDQKAEAGGASNQAETRDDAQQQIQNSEKQTQTAPLENWIDIEQAALLLRERGISRTGRTIQRLCKKGDLECRLVPTENGSRYIINDQSVEALAKRYHEILPGSGSRDRLDDELNFAQHLQLTQAENVDAESATNTQQSRQNTVVENHSNHIVNQHMQQIVDLKDQQIQMLQSQLTTANTQIAVKDEQINTMLERDHETNVLIQNLQRLIALPEGRAQSDNWSQS